MKRPRKAVRVGLPILVIGLLAITVGLLGSGLTPACPVLLGFSVIMGFGDALVFALPFAIAATRFHGGAQRRAIGLTIGALSMAPIIGVPLLTALAASKKSDTHFPYVHGRGLNVRITALA